MLLSKHADIKGILQLRNSKDEKPDRTLIFIHPPIQPRPQVNLKSKIAGNKIANLATEEHSPEELVAFFCQAPDFFEIDDISVPEYHLAEKLG